MVFLLNGSKFTGHKSPLPSPYSWPNRRNVCPSASMDLCGVCANSVEDVCFGCTSATVGESCHLFRIHCPEAFLHPRGPTGGTLHWKMTCVRALACFPLSAGTAQRGRVRGHFRDLAAPHCALITKSEHSAETYSHYCPGCCSSLCGLGRQ